MYLDLKPLERGDTSLLLAAAKDYPIAPEPCTVSIAPVEVSRLVDRFPIAWRRGGPRPDLVAVLGLRDDQTYWRSVRDGVSTIKPLLVEAYPLASIDDGTAEKLPVLVDSRSPKPGASTVRAFADTGEPTPELDRRCQALWTHVRSRRTMAPFFEALESEDLLVPWQLSFRGKGRSAGESLSIEGLHVLRADLDGSPAQRSLVERFGWPASQLMSLHRISLHRIKTLLRDLSSSAA